jgi:hypothetical protein
MSRLKSDYCSKETGMELEKIAPVVISVLVIILIAIISEYSKTFAAITATMPLSVPLSLWIVYAAEHGDQGKMTEFIAKKVKGQTF